MIYKDNTDVGGIKLLYHVCPPVRGDNPRALASVLSPRTGGQAFVQYNYYLMHVHLFL